jgi:hypothetical protein
MPVFLRVRELQGAVKTQRGRLLRLLLVRIGEVPADSEPTFLLFVEPGSPDPL